MQTTQQALAQLKGTRLILCSNCNAQVRVIGFTDRPAPGQDDPSTGPSTGSGHSSGHGLIEICLECPNCSHWYHAYFLNADLRDNRPAPDADRKTRREYQLRFQRLQKDTRRRLGMRKVNGKWLS